MNTLMADETTNTVRSPIWTDLAGMTSENRRAAVVHYRSRLAHALADSRHESSAYETLAKFGEMERTANGYRCISAEAVILRCKRLDGELSALSQ
jgi:hypothetical protein